MFKQIEMGILIVFLVVCGTLWFLYKGEQKKVASLKAELIQTKTTLDQTKIDLGVCNAKLAIKPTVIKKTEYVEVVRVVDSSGNVVSISTPTHNTNDENIVMQPKEITIIKEVVKEAPIRRWTISASIPISIEDIKHLNISTVGLTYQPWKKLDVNLGTLYMIKDEHVLLQGAIRF
jgi:hypothetical protein